MNISGCYLFPHPPIILPEIGRGQETRISATTSALHTAAREIADKEPDTIVLITPHGTMFKDAISLSYGDEIAGDMKMFNAPSVSIKALINRQLSDRIYERAGKEGINLVRADKAFLEQYHSQLVLDHGALIPLYFVNQYYHAYRIVHLTYAPLSDLDLYRFGKVIRDAVVELDEDTVIIASGDLSHRLTTGGPYEYHPDGERFDSQFLKLLEQGDVSGLFGMDKKIINNAGECGRASVIIMLGTLDQFKFSGQLLSYEGTFGVGYGVMSLNIISETESRIAGLKALVKTTSQKEQDIMDPYVRLARDSLTTLITTGEVMENIPDYVPNKIRRDGSGVFVSLKKHGDLRGCIGTIFPVTGNTAEEIIRNAIEAGLRDPRFFPVEEDELGDIEFSVDILTKPEPAEKDMLDPREYGVIVRRNHKMGLLLPNLDGVDTVEKQLSIALKKAGISPGEEYQIQRFRVIRHTEG